MKCYIQWCGALQRTRWRWYLKQLICSCLASQFSGKATKVGSPLNFAKLISQLWGIPQSQYFITLLLDPHWTYFVKLYLYYKKDTKVGSQNFGYQIWFCTRLDMGLLSHTQNCGLCMRWECQEWFPCHRLQRKPLISNPNMHHGMCITHMPWCMLGSLTRGGGENVPGITGACATRNFMYLVRGPWKQTRDNKQHDAEKLWIKCSSNSQNLLKGCKDILSARRKFGTRKQ